VPKGLWGDHSLSLQQKATYYALCSHRRLGTIQAEVSIEALARELGRDRKQGQRYLGRLEKAAHIRRQSQGCGRRNVYYLLGPDTPVFTPEKPKHARTQHPPGRGPADRDRSIAICAEARKAGVYRLSQPEDRDTPTHDVTWPEGTGLEIDGNARDAIAFTHLLALGWTAITESGGEIDVAGFYARAGLAAPEDSGQAHPGN